MRRIALIVLAAAVAALVITKADAAPADFPRAGLVVQDAPLRGAPRDTASLQAQMGRGEALEIRAERGDHWQVWDYRRERGGWLRKGQVLVMPRGDGATAELLAQLRLARQQWGTEGLGLGLAAAYVQAATPAELAGPGGAEALDAMGTFAERIADRAALPNAKPAEGQLAAQIDVAARYGLKFEQFDAEDGRVQVCYDGEAFRRVLAVAATPEQRVRAALALTRPDCLNPRATPREAEARDQWRQQVLAQVDAASLPPHWKNRLQMRRAAVSASLAFAQLRRGATGEAAPALAEFAAIVPTELTEDDQAAYADAAMRVNAARWLGTSLAARDLGAVQLVLQPGADGERCVELKEGPKLAARRCSFGQVALASASLNREGRALALAVQPLDGWRELWLFVKDRDGWRIEVMPPAPAQPGLGVAEFAGWVPGGAQMLLAREFRAEGRYRRSFEVVSLATLATERQSPEPALLGAFQRWSDPAWRGGSPIRR
ncbi:hypothetical protein [Roseateles saccharophilus]|uniref:SH3 domain-containing protein n=1 Tax=Roseateles saccharophilus TaxID=304 RepID=A0A4V2VS40_ROSSA|nr:hypothetical protein [Roseateles saccharophilus]TCV00920.1 hypothetical protein EV671_100749 [Roseateles saccharophilus]